MTIDRAGAYHEPTLTSLHTQVLDLLARVNDLEAHNRLLANGLSQLMDQHKRDVNLMVEWWDYMNRWPPLSRADPTTKAPPEPLYQRQERAPHGNSLAP